MSIHVALSHLTRYTYDRGVKHMPHVVRLRPAPHCRAKVLSYSLQISGGHYFINWQQDPYSNWNARVVFPDPLRELSIGIELVAEMSVYNPFDFFLEESATNFPFDYEPVLKKELAPFLEVGVVGSDFLGYLAKRRAEWTGGRTIDFLVALNQQLQRDIQYLIRLEPGVQTPEETLTKRTGSCRDSAWLLVQLIRHFGLAARFVSGYLIQLTPDVKPLDGPVGPSQDFTDLHAWAEVYLPGAGWIGLDPTSGLLAGEGHLPLSCTPEPSSAAPVSGSVEKCESKLQHEMKLTRIHESPRVTRPYREEEWNAIQDLGHVIDTDLEENDVRLTMGGEPTFVSLDDPDGPEWNFTVVSPAKRLLSGELLRRLRQAFAPGALLHYGQGKWYPGEALPRWALAAFWRRDGVPIWDDDSLIADESKDYGYGAPEAKALLECIADEFGVGAQFILPGYEDAFYYTWKERRLPSNVTPENSRLKDRAERDRITRIFQQGLGEVVGYTLPVQAELTTEGIEWCSGPWFLQGDQILWLVPGDSPMGLRLPLDSLPWVAESEFPWVWPQDPSRPLPELPKVFPLGQRPIEARTGAAADLEPSRRQFQVDPGAEGIGGPSKLGTAPRQPSSEGARNTRAPLLGESASWVVRTALCVEPREGRLYVFLPPVASLEEFLDMLARLKIAVRKLGWPVIIEGYPPPSDPRLQKLAVTPDPGVIEVNLPPSRSWEELAERTRTLYEEARQVRLGTEKFMLDGRHTGTGGGNHIIIGGAFPADSPVLRRPDLLRSLLAYWQNHPSLSWLFSGLFIGPTSQAPRIDEARQDSLYELEIAFQELDGQLGKMGAALPKPKDRSGKGGDLGAPVPWLVDRLFRNLLIDASGNTHRSEFSIDKLFAPETSSGRLGLVELRAFEMPPHWRMSLAQQLLLRGLVSRFWKEPYQGSLVRWGTGIHDRWMLPHFCQTDFQEVLNDLRQSGYDFRLEWFAPHFEFRFPRIGEFVQREVEVELRAALEPWHVLGEESGAGGAVRFVDSSLERLQVKARGLIGERFALTVNGRRLPLHRTGTNGEAVAGVRYRAWQPPECLQPTIRAHTPLVFDLWDTWNERSLGGCTYHVAHPGGRNYTSFPVNAFEAESRRLARFFTHGASQGTFMPNSELLNPDFPFTLDLRRA